MRVLVACEFSGVVREAFRALGHDAWSCDVEPSSDQSEHHFECKVQQIIDHDWDLMIAHPPCTYLTSAGMHWTTRGLRDPKLTEDAYDFVMYLASRNIPRIAIENPIGVLSTKWRKPDQIIQPYQFGHDASKATCLWLKNLPPLESTNYIEPRIVDGKKRWANQTDSGQNKLGPSPDRWKMRSITYAGIANAMAQQWSHLT